MKNHQLDTDTNAFPKNFDHLSASYHFNYDDDIEEYKKRRRKRRSRRSLDLNLFNSEVYESSSKLDQFPIVNTYELDWYFLDKRGRLNIVR